MAGKDHLSTKEHLSQIGRYDKMIKNKLLEIEQLRTIVCGTTIPLKKDKIQTTPNHDKLGDIVTKIVFLEGNLDEIIEKRHKIVEEIEAIPRQEHYDVLAKRYILGMGLTEIVLETGLSEKQVRRYINEAYDVFESMGKNVLK